MKKIILCLLLLVIVQSSVYADTQVKDYQYYQKQIQGQRIPYNVSGLGNAILKGNKDVVEMFMKAGMSPNEKYMGMPMTVYAISYKQPECLDVLLSNNADVEAATFEATLLLYAINVKSSDCTSVLIKHGADVNRAFKNYVPLNYAIKKKQGKIVEMLLQAGAKPNDETVKLISKTKDEYIKETVLSYVQKNK